MAKSKNKKKPPSERAKERARLQEIYKTANYSGLKNLLEQGKLDLKEVRKYYTDARSIAKKRVERVLESKLPFTDQPPEFAKTKELTDEEILKAVHEVNKFLQRPTTVTEREAAYSELLDDLHSKGLGFLDLEDLPSWDRFRKWVRAKGLLKVKYVDGSILGSLFEAGKQAGQNNSEFWSKEWEKYQEMIKGPKTNLRKPRAGGPRLNRKKRRRK